MRQSEQGAVLKILVRTDRAFTNGIFAHVEFLCDSDKRLLVQYCDSNKMCALKLYQTTFDI